MLRLAIVAVPAWFTIAFLISRADVRFKLIVGIVLAVTLAAPRYGLLLAAALAPLARLITAFMGGHHFRMTEAIVVAFLVGWALRGDPDRRGPRAPAPIAAWLFAAILVGSLAGLAWQLLQYPGELPRAAREFGYAYFVVGDNFSFMDGPRLLEGLALVAATVMLFRRHPSLAVTLPSVLAAGAIVAAASSVLAWRQVGGYRVSGHVGDVNAAGSYFALMLCLSLGMTASARDRRRWLWAVVSLAVAVGLWFSESRTAIAAASIVTIVAAAWYAAAHAKPSTRRIAIAAMLTLGIAVTAWRVHRSNFGMEYRQQFYETSLRMIAARPLFGVGIGQYYPLSPLFLSPELAYNYGAENAHNNFLQIGAELGLTGLGLFVVWLGTGFVRAGKALAHDARDLRLLGVAGGVTAFAATWATSHPLLVSEVAFPFWMAFGLMCALAGSTLMNGGQDGAAAAAGPARWRPSGAWLRPAAITMAMCLALLAPIGPTRATVMPPQSADVDGFYGWETSDGVRFRWSRRYASMFVPADVTRVHVPVRMPVDRRFMRPLEVDAMIGGALHSRTRVGESWEILDITLPRAQPLRRFKRIDFRVDRTWQPALYIPGNADMRAVGIQFGEPSMFRGR